ncbi:MAG: VCBS repeat-containing protein, partial [Treponemataceae bacterium]|nr:VCBS repeat-containing protein [Treponemataceae bacterium]
MGKGVLVKVWFLAMVICLLLTTAVFAQPGAPFFQMFVGNYWKYQGTQTPGGDTWTRRDTVVALDNTTVPGQITYKVEVTVNGNLEEKFWFSINQTEMKLWRVEVKEPERWVIIAFENGIPVAKNPMWVGQDPWSDTIWGTVDGQRVPITYQVHVKDYTNVTVPLGTYKAYKLKRTITIGGQDMENVEYWAVPYIGVIKEEFIIPGFQEKEELYEMRIRKPIVDFGSDGKTDISVYRRNGGAWYVLPSSNPSAPYGLGWGGSEYDVPVPADFDGDGKTDTVIYRVNFGGWYIIPSSNPNSPYGLGWGGDMSDIPVPGDYDNDGMVDIAVYRKGTGAWYIRPSGGAQPYG